MQTVKSLADIKNIPMRERPRWYVSEALVTRIPIQDAHEPLVSVNELMKKNGLSFVSTPESGTKLLLRKSVAERLVTALRTLIQCSQGTLTFKITDAFRPLTLQKKYFEEIKKNIAQKENLSGHALWERVTQFIADPDLCPPHTTGGAVDLTLVTAENGEEIPMGTSMNTINDLANTWHLSIPPHEHENRKKLFDAMTSAGFVNLATEWWHYSYGDQYWAAFTIAPHAIYGSIENNFDSSANG